MQSFYSLAEAIHAALVDHIAHIIAQQCNLGLVDTQHCLGEGIAASLLIVVSFHGSPAPGGRGEGADGGEGDVPLIQHIHQSVILHGTGQDHAVHFAVVQGAQQRIGIILCGKADHDVVVPDEGFLADGIQGLPYIRQVQLDEGLGKHQCQIVGAAFRQALGGGAGTVIALLDIVHDLGTGGLTDAALAGNGTGDGGFGHAKITGDIINCDVSFL